MTATRSASASTSRGRRVWPWLAGVVGLVLVGALAGTPNSEGRAFDPTSNGERGTKALVALLKDFDADVKVLADQPPPPDVDIAIAFPGDIPKSREDALRRWVRQGHTLVIADPSSELNPYGGESTRPVGIGFGEVEVRRGACTIDALDQANTMSLGDESFAIRSARRFAVPPGAQQCFTNVAELDEIEEQHDTAVIVSAREGQGHIVSVGAPDIFTNTLLDEADNAVIAVDLLAPRPGQTVAVLQRPAGEVEEPELADLLSTGVKLALVQLVLAFVVYAIFRGRRLGKPVLEPQPVQIPGSELVSAVGNLLQQTKSPDRAAAVLRFDLRRRLCERLGLPGTVSAEVIAASVEARTGIAQETSLPLLVDLPCTTEPQLLDLAGGLDDLRRAVLGGA